MKRAAPIAALLAALASSPARAEDAKAARAHYEKGTVLFKVDRFKEALGEYQAAYVAKPDPSFLFNIAQCHRKIGNRQDAIRFYRKYLIEVRLDTGKDAPNAAAVQKFIDELEAALSRPPPASPPPEAPPPEAPPPGPPPAPSPAPSQAPSPAPSPPAAPVTVNVPVNVNVPITVPPKESATTTTTARSPFVLPQPSPSTWEPAPQAQEPRRASAREAPAARAPAPAGPPVARPPAPPAAATATPAAAADRYAARPTGMFFVAAGGGFATWKEDVSSQTADSRGNYDTRANGPTLGAGAGLGVGYARFFALGDFAYRYFSAGRRGAFLPSTTMHWYDGGLRAGMRSDHFDVWGRLGWSMTSIRIPNTKDDLPSETLAGYTGGGGVDVKDVTSMEFSFQARIDVGLSGERSQETAFGRDLSEGADQTTRWTQWAAAAGWPLARGLDLTATFQLRLVDTSFEGYSERLGTGSSNTRRSTNVIGGSAGLVFRR